MYQNLKPTREFYVLATLYTLLFGWFIIPKSFANDGYTLEEITVTARKREESLQDTPIAVTAFSDKALEQRQVSNISQIEAFTPGLIFDTSEGIGGGSSAQVFIRGVGQTDFNVGTEPGVGIYLDGVYIGRTSGATLDLLDVDRVEVLRGPQGTVFGRNTIGGAIALYSKKPADEFSGRAQVTFGTDERIDGRLSVSVPINERLRSKFVLLTKNQDGFVDVVNTDQQLGDINVDAGRLAVEWETTDKFTINLDLDTTHQRQSGAPTTGLYFDDTFVLLTPGASGPPVDSGLPFPIFFGTIAGFYNTVGQNGIPGVLPAPPPGLDIFGQTLANANGNCPFALGLAPNSSTVNANCFNAQYNTESLYSTYGSRTKNDIDVHGAGLTATWDLTESLTLKSISSYRILDADWTNDIDNSPLLVGETENNIDQEQFSQELQLTGNNEHLQWVIGLYYFIEDARDLGQITTGSGNFLNGADVDNEAIAIFGQASYDINDRLNLTVGGRYTHENKRFTPLASYVTAFFIPAPFFLLPENIGLSAAAGCLENPDGSGACLPTSLMAPEIETRQRVDEFKPMVSISYRFTDTIMAYFTYSEGFKSGGFNQRLIFPTLDPDTLGYAPEFVTVFEGGIKSDWFDNRMRLNAAAFYTDYENLQINVQEGFVPTVRNAGDADIAGFEAELHALPTPALELTVTLAYLDAEYKKVAANANVTTASSFANTPEWSSSIGAVYHYSFGNGHSLSPRIDWSYRSEIFNDAENNPELRQDDLHLLNASLTLESANKNWLASLKVTNLTDKKYIVAGFRNTVGGFGQGVVARQREWSLQLERRF
jgi:iron complex outermembrane receptor protein